jgi:hypothetical protein
VTVALKDRKLRRRERCRQVPNFARMDGPPEEEA